MCQNCDEVEGRAPVFMAVGSGESHFLGAIESGWELVDLLQKRAEDFDQNLELMSEASKNLRTGPEDGIPVGISINHGNFYLIGEMWSLADLSDIFRKQAKLIDDSVYSALGMEV